MHYYQLKDFVDQNGTTFGHLSQCGLERSLKELKAYNATKNNNINDYLFENKSLLLMVKSDILDQNVQQRTRLGKIPLWTLKIESIISKEINQLPKKTKDIFVVISRSTWTTIPRTFRDKLNDYSQID